MFTRPFEDYRLGDQWTSKGRTVTETDVVMFASLTGDWYPLHTDKEWAKQTRFGQRIAHGLLVVSIAMGLTPLEPGIVVAFYGIDRMRFIAPTFIGDTIRVTYEITNLHKKSSGGVVVAAMTVLKHPEQAVVVGTASMLLATPSSCGS